MPENTLALPGPAKELRRLWLTNYKGEGSTGRVWKCRFDDDDKDFFAAKVVEMPKSEMGKKERLRNEFEVYLVIEAACQSRKLQNRISPRCYGAFAGDHAEVIILDCCDDILDSWDKLNNRER